MKEPQTGALTNSMDVTSDEFKEFQQLILERASAQSEEEKLDNELFSLRVRIEDYLSENKEDEELITVGDFLKMYLKKLNIKQNKLAAYLNLKPANLNKLLSGSRKINFRLALIFSRLFKLDPKVWMLIQVKNDYMGMKDNQEVDLEQYKLQDLLAKS